MASITYNEARKRILDGTLALSTATIKFMLVGAGYTPDKDHIYITASGAGSAELSGTGYTAGFGSTSRKTMASKVFAKNDTTDKASLDCADPSWTAINAGTVGAIIAVVEGTSDADSLLVACADITDSPTNGGDWTYQVDAAGLLTLS